MSNSATSLHNSDRMQLDDDELRELYSKIGSVFDDDGNDDECVSLFVLTVQ